MHLPHSVFAIMFLHLRSAGTLDCALVPTLHRARCPATGEQENVKLRMRKVAPRTAPSSHGALVQDKVATSESYENVARTHCRGVAARGHRLETWLPATHCDSRCNRFSCPTSACSAAMAAQTSANSFLPRGDACGLQVEKLTRNTPAKSGRLQNMGQSSMCACWPNGVCAACEPLDFQDAELPALGVVPVEEAPMTIGGLPGT